MKKLLFILLVVIASCKDEVTDDCINQDNVGKVTACPYNLDPVCGCNDKTYSNECFANAAGVVHWTKGECSK